MSGTALRALLLLVTLAACERATPAKSSLSADRISFPGGTADTAMATELVPLARPGRMVGGTAGAAAAAPSPAPENEQAPSNPAVTSEEVTPGSMLVRVGQASLQVDSLETGIARVRDLARRTGAVVANTTMEGGRDQTRAASLQLRIPSARFDEAVNALTPIGKLESVNVSAEDVGEEYVDIQARVANARQLEQRLLELLARRTGKLSDVLSVERELARVREEIERYEGRMRYLRSRASVSTLTVALHEPYPVVADRPGARPIRDAFVQAWRNLVGFTAGFIELLGVLVPLGVVVGVIVLVVRRVVPSVMPRFAAVKGTPTETG